MLSDVLSPDDITPEYKVGSGDVPPTFQGLNEREEHNQQGKPSFVTEPEDSFSRLLPLNIGWHEAPDPIRESDFWNWGMKIKPGARQRITEATRLTEGEWSDEHFHIGKLLGYLYSEMHQGGQRPIDIRGNLQPGTPVTFGALYETAPPVTEPGPAYTSAGFDLSGQDGYPY